MNYYELFQIPNQLKIDTQLLRQQYLKICKQYHPDRFGQSLAIEQEHAITMTEQANKGYQTLSQWNPSILYFLTTNNIINANEVYQLPQQFLMEMMELNEKIMDGKMDQDEDILKACAQEIELLKLNLNNQIKPLLESNHLYDEDLNRLKNYYYSIKYVNRLEQLFNNEDAEM
jgi:molecular chaperone HscB